MGTDDETSRGPATQMGGAVESASRAKTAKATFYATLSPAGERYEVREPFAEITHESGRVQEAIATAHLVGSDRFEAIDTGGKRTTIRQVSGEGQRGLKQQAPPIQPPEHVRVRDEAIDALNNAISRPDHTNTPPPFPGPSEPKIEAIQQAKAERAALVSRVESALLERYLIKRISGTVSHLGTGRTEYRFRGDATRVAFTESTFKLATDTNSPSVARSMVDVAQAREWRSLRISGSDDFRRMVWLEAAVRGVKAVGYEPNTADLQLLAKEREVRTVNRIEPAYRGGSTSKPASADRPSARGSARKTVLVAIEAVMVDNGVPVSKREAVLAAATEKLGERARKGQSPQVKLYDQTAPSRAGVSAPHPEIQHGREQVTPAPVR